jgi:hypothetical protein
VLGFAVWALLTILHVTLLFKALIRAGLKAYFANDAWGVYDAVTCVICVAALGLHALLFSSGGAIAAASQLLASQSSYSNNPLINFFSMSEMARLVESIAYLLVFVRCLKFAENMPGIGSHLNDAVAKAAAAAKRMASAAIVFVVLTFGVASASCAAFGALHPKWGTVWEAARTLLTILFARFSGSSQPCF